MPFNATPPRHPSLLHRVLSSACCLLISSFVVVACGGGGGSSAGGSAVNGSGLNPGLSGRLWYPHGGQATLQDTSDANSGVSQIRLNPAYGYTVASIARDARLVVMESTDITAATTQIEVHDATKPVDMNKESIALSKQLFSSYINKVRISPDSRYMALIYSQDITKLSTSNGLVIYDLQNQADVNKVTPKRVRDTGLSTRQIADIDWLPGGEYRYLRYDGSLVAGSASAADPSLSEKQVGKIVRPTGYVENLRLAISPDGKQIAMTFEAGPLPNDPLRNKSDVWLIDINGGNLERLTNDDLSSNPVWSPDGKYIVLAYQFNINSGLVGRGDLGNTCDRWYVPATARNAAFKTGQPLLYKTVDTGFAKNLICPPMAIEWTQ
jgi:WD40-like Beta Propeller Repeat